MAGVDPQRPFVVVGVGVLTLSDTRTLATDTSGSYLAEQVTALGHRLARREVLADDRAGIERTLRAWCADPDIAVVITTGGTGITGRDVTPEAVEAVADKLIPGFGELFRWLSYQTVGTSTVQSRALAAVCGDALIFALPGSSGAVRDAWEGILRHQLDARHRPCNFIELLPRLAER